MSALWQECAAWLVRLEVLQATHQVMSSDSSIQDLAFLLRDGVLLCHVAAALDPAAVDMRTVNQKPQLAQFLCLKNIRIFLTACSNHFGLRDTDLFEAAMLYDYTDFARVLHTLSRLSTCAKARSAKAVAGFPTAHVRKDEEQIYRTLEELADEDKYEEYYCTKRGALAAADAADEEDIYEDLCSFKSSSSRKMQRQLSFQPKEKRDYCIKELVETEGNYVDVLNMLKKHFIRAISNIKETDKKIIFLNITDLGETHAAFYQEILESVTGRSQRRIPEIFVDFKERFLKYGEYCSGLPKAQETLDALVAKDDNIRDEVARCEVEANEGKFRLRDLLAVPMQRVLKYHLLLRELNTHTGQTHPDRAMVEKAYDAMLDVADYINEVKRDSEQLHIIREIQKSITESSWKMPSGIELKDYGRLRKDSELRVLSHDGGSAAAGGSSKAKNRYVFVFDKVLLLCKPARGDHYTYKDSLKLAEYKVQDPSGSQSGTATVAPRRWTHSFMLVHAQELNALTLFARTEEDKRKWVAAIREALATVVPPTRLASTHQPVMHTFETPSVCDHCLKLLKGLFFQGYKCERCGKAMHKSCIAVLAKCGTPSPSSNASAAHTWQRPGSMQLPQRTSLGARLSTMSLDDPFSIGGAGSVSRQASLAALPPISPSLTSSTAATRTSNGSDYINTCVENQSWFVGYLERDSAETRLSDLPVGTFLVRRRIQNGEYALSLRTQIDVKHMKIVNEGNAFYLSDAKPFKSIMQLIIYFSSNSLQESFKGLDATLRFSVGEVSLVEALFDFDPDPNHRNLLRLRKGDRITVIERSTDLWWKAIDAGGSVGFVPKDYVAEIGANGVAHSSHVEQNNSPTLEAQL